MKAAKRKVKRTAGISGPLPCTNCGCKKALSEYYFHKTQNRYTSQCKDCQCKKVKARYHVNPEKENARTRAWRKANIEKVRTQEKNYRKTSPEKYRAKNAKRRADRLKATPAWADLKKIAQIYKDCPPGYHIDHIFPLRSPIMCGLHVENNLQYLPAKENISKGNRVSLEKQLTG